jgi:beta-xylosidase
MALTYTNPVWPGYFADPFVLRVGNTYYAYGTSTGLDQDTRGKPAAFTVLRSTTLTEWKRIGGALPVEPAHEADAFWAPEVAMRDGRFYLYFSSAPHGADEMHRLYVAVADQPEGPFRLSRLVLPERDKFSIDAHPFQDPRTGRWFLFFAQGPASPLLRSRTTCSGRLATRNPSCGPMPIGRFTSATVDCTVNVGARGTPSRVHSWFITTGDTIASTPAVIGRPAITA